MDVPRLIGQIRPVSRTPADPPLRQLTRLRTELGIGCAQLTAGLFPEQPFLGIEFGIVARVCLPDWTNGRVLARPEAPERAITVRKMAASLGGAPETVRRHVNQLRDRGIFTVSGQGVSLATTAANEALVMHYYRGVHDRFVRLIEDMAATCDIDLAVGETETFGAGDIIERAVDTLLLPIDTYRPAEKSLSAAFLLWGALTLVAVRSVTFDPELSRRYANAIPPDEHRVGASLRSLATTMAIPYATAWRQMQALHDAGLVTRLGGDRWAVLTHNLLDDRVRDLGTQPSLLLLRKLRELAQLGLDPARAADHYLLGRPPLAEMGLSQNG